MKARSIFLVTIFCFLCGFAGAHAPEESADDVLAKSIDAQGGIDKIHAVKSMRVAGALDLGNGQGAQVVQEWKHGKVDAMRMEMTSGATQSIRVYKDGAGWEIMPQFGQQAPTPMSPPELSEMREESDMFGPLVDHKQKGNTVELLGRVTVDDRDCYQLKVTLKDGQVRTHFIDAQTLLESRIESSVKTDGGEINTIVTMSDYRKVDGLMIPFATSVETTIGNKPLQKYSFKTDKLELNPRVDDADFDTPPEIATSQPSK